MKNINVGTFKQACLASVFALTLTACGGGADTTTNTVVTPLETQEANSQWELVWADEFEGDTLNPNNWSYEVNCLGGGNQEKQCYTENPENLFVADGNLNIVALPAEGEAQPYSSARINSANKADFKYGRFEMRAQLPSGQGAWPAFWMMPTDSVYGTWPRSGEIDIMEAVNLKTDDPRTDGADQRSVYGSLHYGQLFPDNDSSGMEFIFPEGSNPADDFNTYAVEWEQGEIRWYVNDFLYARQTRSEVSEIVTDEGIVRSLTHKGWYTEYFDSATGAIKTVWDDAPFDQRFHMILNLAVGGSWPENVNDLGIDADAFANGQSLVVDYVRVYECPVNIQTGKGCETLKPGWDVINETGQVVGYDATAPAFREGNPPTPVSELSGGGSTTVIFDNAVDNGWEINACCDGNSTSQIITEDDGNLAVQFDITGDAAVVGFDSRLAGADAQLNIAPLSGSGFLTFDVKVITQPSSGSPWLLKVESNGQCCSDFAEIALEDLAEGAPVVGEWKTYSVPVADLIAAGLEPTQVDAVFVFPGFTTGAGASVQLDNFSFVSTGSVEPIPIFTTTTADAPWSINACCDGNATSQIVTEGDNDVVEFAITGNASVLGFDTRTAGESFNIATMSGVGSLKFDIKVLTQPSSGADWLVKIESDGQCCSDFAEFNLSDLPEGAPVTGEWKSYSVPVVDMISAGLNPTMVDAVFVFPGFTTGAGAVVQFDNFRFEASADAGGGDGGGDNGGDGGGDGEGETPQIPVYPIGQEIVTNGSFDTDAEGWTGGMMMVDGGQNVLYNEVSAAGDPWSVNSSQVLAIEPATNYTLTFTARASEARDIIAGIGLNAAPFSSDTETVALTTDYQTFTLELTSLDEQGEPFSDPAARVLFDMGAQVGDVYIDNVSLVKSAELIVNNGFQFGANQWLGAIGEANIVDEDGNNVYMVDVTAAGNAYDVNISQEMPIEPGETYVLTFKAKASVNRTMLAGIGLNAAPFSNNSEEVALTTDWQTFTYTLEAIADGDDPSPFGDATSRVLFDMGADIGMVYIDDVSVEIQMPEGPMGEMLTNGSFDSADNWINAIGPDNIIDDNGDSVYHVNVTAAGNPYDVNISQVITLVPSTEYTVSFRAKASVARTMLAGLGLNASPWHAATETAALTTDWQTFTYNITTISDADPDGNTYPFGDDNSRVLFDMGSEIGEVYIDDVSVMLTSEVGDTGGDNGGDTGGDTAEPSGVEKVVNGTFDSTASWINAIADINVIDDNGDSVYNVNVTAAGNPYDVNISQIITLEPSTAYTVSFRAKASVTRTMLAGLGLNYSPWYATTETVNLTTDWQTFTYTITTISDPDPDGNTFPYGDDNSRVLFDMGAEIGQVSIDDVSVVKQ